MAFHNELGQKGEGIAVSFLKRKGYQILATNWRYYKAEVDIIAKTTEAIVFVEVRTRSYDYFGQPEETVDKRKQKLLKKAAEAYMDKHDLFDYEGRFDIVAIIQSEGVRKTYHLEDAFFFYAD